MSAPADALESSTSEIHGEIRGGEEYGADPVDAIPRKRHVLAVM